MSFLLGLMMLILPMASEAPPGCGPGRATEEGGCEEEEPLIPLLPYSDNDDHNKNRNGNDCNRSSAECNDNDFSPSFDKSPVDITICLPQSTCNFSF